VLEDETTPVKGTAATGEAIRANKETNVALDPRMSDEEGIFAKERL